MEECPFGLKNFPGEVLQSERAHLVLERTQGTRNRSCVEAPGHPPLLTLSLSRLTPTTAPSEFLDTHDLDAPLSIMQRTITLSQARRFLFLAGPFSLVSPSLLADHPPLAIVPPDPAPLSALHAAVTAYEPHPY